MRSATFTTTMEPRPRGGVAVRLPFDPSVEWGEQLRHDVTGTIEGRGVRGTITSVDGEHYLQLGPAWCRDRRVVAGNEVSVKLAPEEPQIASLSDDIAAAFGAEPEASRFFGSLATFYRKGFVRWIEEARRPETRARRISETVAALKAGRRER